MRPLACFVAASVLAATAAIVGCSGDPEDAPDYQVTDDNNITAQDPSPPAAADPGEEPAKPAPDFVVDPEPFMDDGGMMDDAGAMMDAAAPKPDSGTTAPVTKTMTCTSTYGSHKSTSTLTWVVSGSVATIHSLYVTVHNSYGRNLNDVDVWVTQPGAAEYKAFNSGDVLVSDKKINVRLPADWKKPTGTRIRLETNFDQSGTDPSASCSITLTK